MRTKWGPFFLSAALLAAAPAGAAAPDTLPRTLAGLERRADRVRADVEAAHARMQSPEPLARDVSRLRKAARALTRRLHGRPADEVMPLLQRLDRIERTLATVDSRIADEPERILRPARARAMSGTGAIVGQVTDARTGAPIDDLVEVWDASGDFVDYGFTDENGVYVVDSLSAGTYFVVTDTFDHANELFDNIVCDPDCEVTTGTPVPVANGQVVFGINFALVPLSVIEGTLLDAATLQPITGAQLRLYDAQGHTKDFAVSGPDGQYRMDRVHPGVHFMRVQHDAYLDELWDDMPCQPDCDPTTGTPIVVTLGTDVAGIDFRLRQGGSISGTITDAGTGQPMLTGVEIYDAAGDFVDATSSFFDGRYQQLDLPSGTYFALTSSSTHADELYDNLPCTPSCVPTQGTPIAVAAGQEHAGVNFALLRLGAVSGRVTNAAGLGLGAQLAIYDAQNIFRGSASTDATGAYQVGGLLAGNHFATAAASGYLGELYDNLPCHPSCMPTFGTPIPVVLGTTTTGVDFRLDLGGSITGIVRGQSTGAPLSGAYVIVYGSNGQSIDSTFTNGTGRFSMNGLPAGTYYARADLFLEYLPELYREIPCTPTCPPPTSGTAIPVVSGQASGGVDFTLTRLGQITGRVTDTATGLPVSTSIYLYDGTGQLWSIASSGSFGAYLFNGLMPGTYYLKTDSSDYIVDELYNNKTCEPACTVTTGTPVAAAFDTTTSGIDFSLRRTVFVDVPVTHFAWRFVEAVYAAGVTSGCGGPPLRYCPDNNVTRAQMAVFLLRSKEGPAYVPPPAVGVFVDVPASDPFAPWIEELARRQITGGCSANPPRYCPNDPTTRAQMAPLLLVTKEGGGYQPPPAEGVFQDVPASDPFARWIEELVRRQVTGGCNANPPLYCPGQATTRAQMAVFLATTFALPLP